MDANLNTDKIYEHWETKIQPALTKWFTDRSRAYFGCLEGETKEGSKKRKTKEEATLERLRQFYSKSHGEHANFGCRTDQMDSFTAALTGISLEKLVKVREEATTGSKGSTAWNVTVMKIGANEDGHNYRVGHCYFRPGDGPAKNLIGELRIRTNQFREGNHAERDVRPPSADEIASWVESFDRCGLSDWVMGQIAVTIGQSIDNNMPEDVLRASQMWTISLDRRESFKEHIMSTFGVQEVHYFGPSRGRLFRVTDEKSEDYGAIGRVNDLASSDEFWGEDLLGFHENWASSLSRRGFKTNECEILNVDQVLEVFGMVREDLMEAPAAEPETVMEEGEKITEEA